MLRHFKMEIRRQQELESLQRFGGGGQQPAASQQQLKQQNAPLALVSEARQQLAVDLKVRKNVDLALATEANKQNSSQAKRVRGRRSSKPQMEKRRRARINECLDILKSYVLNDTANLNRLGIDPAASENRDEDTIARQLLKNSGLIHRHRGRKNPNKLEKADILELTVDYVRRLHDQRDELLVSSTTATYHRSRPLELLPNDHFQPQPMLAQGYLLHGQDRNQNTLLQQVVPAHLNQPLKLDLSPKSRSNDSQSTPPPTLRAYQPPPNTPLTPPPSSASSIRSGSHEVETNLKQQDNQNQMSQMILSRVLDGYNFCQ